ncbi:transmembrane 7 superfamily member 3-like [Clytia hemisphaerica]|uniref:Transmembrane protein 198 n=1 Tax=Clytia hemisphaerica TaxID=252671 RepID=A0A7M5UZL5_9CNID
MVNSTLMTSKFLEERWRNKTLNLYHDFVNKNDMRHLLIVEGVALAGLLIMLFGYRFIRFAMFVCGFWLSFSVFYTFSPVLIRQHYSCDKSKFYAVHLVSSVMVGTLIGIFTASLYRFGIMLIGKCLGFLLAMVLLHTDIFQNISSYYIISIFVTLVALVTTALTWRFEKLLMILATSLVGSFTLFCGIDIFLQNNFSLLVISVLIYLRDAFLVILKHQFNHHHGNKKMVELPNFHDSLKPAHLDSMFTSIWIFVTICACAFQYFMSAKEMKNGGEICPLFSFSCCKKKKIIDEK